MKIEIPKATFDEVERALRKIIIEPHTGDTFYFYLGIVEGAKIAMRASALNGLQVERWCIKLDDLSEM